MFNDKKSFLVEMDEDTYNVKVSFYGNKNSKKIIVFSQGYCYDSILYLDFFKKFEKDYLIVAPEINGLRIKGNKGIFDNSNFDNSQKLFQNTISSVLANKKVFCVMGQSMGGNVSLGVKSEKAVLINPQIPTKKNVFVFLSQGVPTLAKEMSTKKSGKFRLKVVYDYFMNFTSNITNNLKYLNSVKKQKFEIMFEKTNRKVLLINAAKKGFDGFFNYDKKKFKKYYKNISFIDLSGTHSKILYESKDFAKEILKFLNS